jgi:hypothetical protein
MIKRQHKPAEPIEVLSVAPATINDIAELAAHGPQQRIAKLRDTHHLAARLVASGLNNKEVAYHAGYSVMRVSQLLADPTFVELVETYRQLDNKTWLESRDHFYDRVAAVRNKALRQIEDQLDAADDENPIPLARLKDITEMGADRTGYPRKTMNTNVNIDFAAQLEAAIARSAKVIEHQSE